VPRFAMGYAAFEAQRVEVDGDGDHVPLLVKCAPMIAVQPRDHS